MFARRDVQHMAAEVRALRKIPRDFELKEVICSKVTKLPLLEITV